MVERRSDPASERLGVFVPAVLGFGVLVSVAMLIADVARRFFPNAGTHRRQRIAMGAHSITAGAASAAGYQVERPDWWGRELRARWLYLLVGTVAGVAGVLVVRLGLVTYFDQLSLLHHNPWAVILAGIAGGFLIGAALISLLPSIFHTRPPKPVRALVQNTWLGRPAEPPSDVREVVGRISQPTEEATL